MSEKRRPTLEDVAREAGVSLSTVDRVLNLRAGVRADTAQRIADAAARLGFHGRNIIEQRLLQNRPTLRLGFLLRKRDVPFYQGLAQALSDAAAVNVRARVRVMVGYLDDLEPAAAAARILAMRGEVDGLALVAADHLAVREAVATLRAEGMPVLALISELAAAAGAAYAGVDNRRMGRMAGWFVAQLAPRPGQVAVMLGTQRFQCQELCEMSFRSYLSEVGAEWEHLAPRITLEDETFAYSNALDLLLGHPELTALYVAGGGIEGVLRALRELDAQQVALPIVVCHDLTPVTRKALQDRIVQVVLSHPVEAMARKAVEMLVEALTQPANSDRPDRALLPIQVDIVESV